MCPFHFVSERCSLVMSQISFAGAHDLLITCFQKFKLRTIQRVQHVAQEGYSIDSTHTEPYANRLSHGLRTFDEFVTTALVHNPTGKGGFAVSFYVQLQMKRNCCDSSSANCLQGSQVAVSAELARDAQVSPAIFVLDILLVSIRLQHPKSSSTGSDNKSLLLLRISNPCDTNVQF